MSRSSFRGMFGDSSSAVNGVVIPTFQRDYAQGRTDPQATEIRVEFVRDLCAALVDGAPSLSLDFVYGEIDKHGALVPLDGQQRLTTLFLLHWYVAVRSGALSAEAPWTRFSYRTRPSAEHFCRALVVETAGRTDVAVGQKVSEWVADQNWFLYVWNLDPTIRGMLEVLDEIQKCMAADFDDAGFLAAWARLDPGADSIWFHFQPLPDMGDEVDLYVKMNSRGKPLTRFESLKAHLEHTLDWDRDLRQEVARAMDGRWTDLMWAQRRDGDDRDELDRRFIRFLRFVVDAMAWEAGTSETVDETTQALTSRVTNLFGPDDGRLHAASLITAFDVWAAPSEELDLDDLFCLSGTGSDDLEQLVVFFDDPDLFRACCDGYGTDRFTLAQTLLLYAEMLFRSGSPGTSRHEVLRSLRVLRNLLEATNLERNEMPSYVREIRRLVRDGVTPESAFSGAQRGDELAKKGLLTRSGRDTDLEEVVFRLEDHRLLRGSLVCFERETDAETFSRRAETFHTVFAGHENWQDLFGALLVHSDAVASPEDCGWRRSDAHRQYPPVADRADGAWRTYLTANDDSDRLASTRRVLSAFLDAAAESGDPAGYPRRAVEAWSRDEEGFDAKYYFLSYGVMRDNTSGVFHLDHHGFIARRLRPGQRHPASRQHDPYLLAVKDVLGPATAEQLGDPGHVWWMEIWLRVGEPGGFKIKSDPAGFKLLAPVEWTPRVPTGFEEVQVKREPLNDGMAGEVRALYLISIPRTRADRPDLDSVDRVQVGAALVRDILGSGQTPDGA